MPVACDKDVFRLEIAMENAVIVRCRKAPHNLKRVFDRLSHRQGAIAQARPQGLAL